MGICDADVIVLLHAVDEVLDQLVELAIYLHFVKLLAHLLVEEIAFHQGALDGAAEVVQRLFFRREIVVAVVLEPAL